MNATPNLSTKRSIILTGATGVVGSHVLYELLHQRLIDEFDGEIILLVRSDKKNNISAQERIHKFLDKKIIPEFLLPYALEELTKYLLIIECEFSSVDLSEILARIKKDREIYLIHSAASTNLAIDKNAENENREINYQGSLNLFESCKNFITKLTYISTVYASGRLSGIIKDEYNDLINSEYRNPYELYKSKTERALANSCSTHDIEYQILRPGVVVGRLIDHPLYYLPKYNVVYAFAEFFHNLKKRRIDAPINIRVNSNTSLHLVSVDYVAKAIIKAYINPNIDQLNIIPEAGLEENYIRMLLHVVGYENYHFVDKHTAPTTPYQRAYQSKVAPSFEPYINDDAFLFDNKKLSELMTDIPMVSVKDSFESLIKYAVDHDFK